MKVIKEHEGKVAEYVHHHYENVQVFLHDNWMRLDFNQDGKVSIEDLKKTVKELYDFMRNYPYYNKATEIKSTLYNEAIKYMQRDLNEDRQNEGSSTPSYEQKDEISEWFHASLVFKVWVKSVEMFIDLYIKVNY